MANLAKDFEQIYDIVLIGSRNQEYLRRYNTDEEMDIVIVMFDSSYWKVFTKDKNLIERWSKKFRKVEWLNDYLFELPGFPLSSIIFPALFLLSHNLRMYPLLSYLPP